MLRKSARVCGRLTMSAVISWSLIPIAVADAPAPASAEPAAAAQPAKRLHTVPEDGLGDDHWLSGATRIVREILAQRPNEDLVICVAGCVPKQDRVVYAQPAEAPSKPANVVSDATPVAPKATEEPAAQAPARADAVDAKRMEFVPTAGNTADTPAPTEGAKEPAPETVDEPSNEAVEPEGPAETQDGNLR